VTLVRSFTEEVTVTAAPTAWLDQRVGQRRQRGDGELATRPLLRSTDVMEAVPGYRDDAAQHRRTRPSSCCAGTTSIMEIDVAVP